MTTADLTGLDYLVAAAGAVSLYILVNMWLAERGAAAPAAAGE